MGCQRKQAPSAHQPWLFATQSQNTAVQCGLDPATQISSTPDFIEHCAWFQAASNPRSSHGCQCSAMLHLLLYVVKLQLTICFKSSKPIQIGLCMLMSLSIHLHVLHLCAPYGQTWQVSTQLRSGERTGRRLLWSATLLLPHCCYRRHTWSLTNRFQTGQGPCRANLHKWGLAQSPSWDFLIKPLTLHREQNSVRIIYQRDGITYANMLHLAQLSSLSSRREELRYDTRCYFNVRSKADISQLNLPHGTDN